MALTGSFRQDAHAALPGYHLPSHQPLCLRCPPSPPGERYLYLRARCEALSLQLRIYTYYLPTSTNVESRDEFQENPYMLFLLSVFISPGIGNYFALWFSKRQIKKLSQKYIHSLVGTESWKENSYSHTWVSVLFLRAPVGRYYKPYRLNNRNVLFHSCVGTKAQIKV